MTCRTIYCYTEAMHLAGRNAGWYGQQPIWQLLHRQRLFVHPYHEQELASMYTLIKQYRDIPMDLADASLVAAAEVLEQRQIFTLDKDFYIYRLPENQAFEVVPGPA